MRAPAIAEPSKAVKTAARMVTGTPLRPDTAPLLLALEVSEAAALVALEAPETALLAFEVAEANELEAPAVSEEKREAGAEVAELKMEPALVSELNAPPFLCTERDRKLMPEYVNMRRCVREQDKSHTLSLNSNDEDGKKKSLCCDGGLGELHLVCSSRRVSWFAFGKKSSVKAAKIVQMQR